MRDRASGVHPDILEHLPPQKNRSLPTVLLYALTCDFTGGCPPPPKDVLEKEMATHSSVLAWRLPGKGESGGLPSMGSHRVLHD